MSDLDDNLRELILELEPESVHVSVNFGEEIEQIKRAFADAGYVQSPKWEGVTSLRWKDVNTTDAPEIEYDKPGQRYGDVLMTGKEFYNRYVDALRGGLIPVKLIEDNEVLSTMTLCDGAAKRAAGLEVGDD